MTILASESFAGVDANPIGGNWTTITGYSALQRLSNTVQRTTGNCGAHYNAAQPPDDQYVKMVIGTAGYEGGPAVRISTSATTYYLFDIDQGTSGAGQIYKCIAGVFTLLVGNTTAVPVAGDTVELRVIGTTLSGWLNGVQQCSVDDSSIASGRFGIALPSNSPVIKYSSFEGGDFNDAPPLLGQAWT